MATTNRAMDTMPSNSLQPSVPFNADLAILDAAVYGTTSIEFTSDANLTLTQAQCDTSTLVLTDSVGPTLSAARDVIFPAHFPLIHVTNNTAQILTLKKSGQTGITLAAGADCGVASGVTDVVRTSQGGGAGVTPVGKHAVPVMAGAIAPSVAGGCAALASIASAANQPDLVSLDFDATTVEYAQFAIPMPKSWDEGTITAQFRWSHAATATNFGAVWGIQAVAVSDDDTIAVAYGTAQTVADTGGTTNDLYITTETSAITVAGSPANGDTVYFRVYRLATDGSDTMTIDARLHSVVIFMTTNAGTDA